MDLDHVALGLHDVTEPLFTLVGRLGAGVLDGGTSMGFRIVQVRLGRRPDPADPSDRGEGMKVELMEPWATDRFDFLARFLERNGEGPHHLTFKVKNIREEISRLEAAGYTPVRTQLVNPWWREAFYHPKQTFGTVIQLAEASFDPTLVPKDEAAAGRPDEPASETSEDDYGSVEWWPEPPPRAASRAVLRRVVVGVPDLEAAHAFFDDVLLGDVVRKEDGRVELAWPGGGRVMVERRPDRPPGVDRFECERPGTNEAEELLVGGAHFVVGPSEG